MTSVTSFRKEEGLASGKLHMARLTHRIRCLPGYPRDHLEQAQGGNERQPSALRCEWELELLRKVETSANNARAISSTVSVAQNSRDFCRRRSVQDVDIEQLYAKDCSGLEILQEQDKVLASKSLCLSGLRLNK